MTYVLKMKTKVEVVHKIGLVPSHGFACTQQELPNEIFIRARSIHGVQNKSDIVLCKKYGDNETADLIAKSMENETNKYWRVKNA